MCWFGASEISRCSCADVASGQRLRNAGLHTGVFGSFKSEAVGRLLRESWGIVMMEITEEREQHNLHPHG